LFESCRGNDEREADKFVGLRLPGTLLERITVLAKQKKISQRSKAVRALIARGK
jgi:metal-responsive CopG/Arc/MetJ family transcriptional regulator